ncbi:MAG: WYL domain-containing protein [Pseudomarimonas sp.]
MDSPDAQPPRWSQLQRFAFIERRLYWESTLNRQDLMARFGISAPQASMDVQRYAELAPGNVEFDRSRKAYVVQPGFAPKYFEPSARNYLSQLLLRKDKAVPAVESWLGKEPGFDAIPRVRRKMDAETLRPIVTCIHQRLAIRVLYQSMTSPEPTWREIAPHALAYDGARWHARSWCYKKSMFTDFVLARMLALRETRPSGIEPGLDGAWSQLFTMELAPHPDLPEGQKRAIEMDFGMIDGMIGIEMRLCLTEYFERQYGLDIPREALPAWRRQVVLNNREALLEMRGEFGEAASSA